MNGIVDYLRDSDRPPYDDEVFHMECIDNGLNIFCHCKGVMSVGGKIGISLRAWLHCNYMIIL